MPTKEEIYDDQISPLMSKVIAICKEHKIANVCSFFLGDSEEGSGLHCTTAMVQEDFEPSDELEQCYSILMQRGPSPLMITVRDGDGNVKRMDTIL